jgi:hypothetical protein
MNRFLSVKGITAGIFISSLLLSCGPAAKDNTTRREIEENEHLKAVYKTMEGKYEGMLYSDETRDVARPVELSISVVDVADGVDENRQVRIRPEIRGFFKWAEDSSAASRFPMVGRVYVKGVQKEAASRQDIATIVLAPIANNTPGAPGQVRREVYMNLNVNGDFLSGKFTEIGNVNRAGYVEFKPGRE